MLIIMPINERERKTKLKKYEKQNQNLPCRSSCCYRHCGNSRCDFTCSILKINEPRFRTCFQQAVFAMTVELWGHEIWAPTVKPSQSLLTDLIRWEIDCSDWRVWCLDVYARHWEIASNGYSRSRLVEIVISKGFFLWIFDCNSTTVRN